MDSAGLGDEGECMSGCQDGFEGGARPAAARASLGEVIDAIMGTHHARLRAQLPAVRDLVDDVVAGASPETAGELSELHRLYATLLGEVGRNLSHEEQLIFPAIRRIEHRTMIPGCQAGMVGSRVRFALAEHRRIAATLTKMTELSARYLSPAGPCETCHALQSLLNEIEGGLAEHHRLEEDGVFAPAVELELALSRRGAGPAVQ